MTRFCLEDPLRSLDMLFAEGENEADADNDSPRTLKRKSAPAKYTPPPPGPPRRFSDLPGNDWMRTFAAPAEPAMAEPMTKRPPLLRIGSAPLLGGFRDRTLSAEIDADHPQSRSSSPGREVPPPRKRPSGILSKPSSFVDDAASTSGSDEPSPERQAKRVSFGLVLSLQASSSSIVDLNDEAEEEEEEEEEDETPEWDGAEAGEQTWPEQGGDYAQQQQLQQFAEMQAAVWPQQQFGAQMPFMPMPMSADFMQQQMQMQQMQQMQMAMGMMTQQRMMPGQMMMPGMAPMMGMAPMGAMGMMQVPMAPMMMPQMQMAPMMAPPPPAAACSGCARARTATTCCRRSSSSRRPSRRPRSSRACATPAPSAPTTTAASSSRGSVPSRRRGAPATCM